MKLLSFLFSTRLMAMLFICFAASMGVATFIENEYNTDTARLLVYNTKWFELIMVLFFVNFIGNIKKYKLYKKEKWATLLLHFSFIFIIIGAFITRYISFEGMMPIKEGETSDEIVSEKTYVKLMVYGKMDGEEKRRTFEKEVLFSGALEQDNLVSYFASNDCDIKSDFNKIPFEVSIKDFTMAASENFVEDENGQLFIKIVESQHGERHEHFIKEGTSENIHNQLYTFNNPIKNAINFTIEADNEVYVEAPFGGDYIIMKNQVNKKELSPDGQIEPNKKTKFFFRSMYRLGPVQFVADNPLKGNKIFQSNGDFKDKNLPNLIRFEIKTQGETNTIDVLGVKGKQGKIKSIKIGELEFYFMYGSKIYKTPFEIKLNDFIAKKYPGTEKSFSSFESKVTVIDKKEEFDHQIYMNHVLDHKGYRFFQASYFPELDGTILSVNYDFWGTWFSYIGYGLLYLSMMLILFVRGTRFFDLKTKLDRVRDKKSTLLSLLLILTSAISFAQNHSHSKPTEEQVEKILFESKIPVSHASKFGSLVIQDAGGRMKPANTFASELLRKVSKSDEYKSVNSTKENRKVLDANQVLLSITMFPQAWYHVPIINLAKNNDSIRDILNVKHKQKYIAMADFFDEKGSYKLSPYLDEAYQAAVKNQFQKDFILADERVNLLHSALSGAILKIFPIPSDKNNKWVSYPELTESPIAKMDSTFLYTKNVLPLYVTSLLNANDSKDFKQADELLTSLKHFQKRFGHEVMPSEDRINSEILYNKYDIFKKLFSWYVYASSFLFLLCIVQIFYPSRFLRYYTKISIWFIVGLFCLQTAGLAARWYISGHAPWSDAYESMIYVSWATMLFGLLFGRKSELTIASTAFVVSMILMIAHWNWMDPAIANLQPVLNSYWLMIHVAVIVGSYGPLGIGMVLGFVALLLMIFTTKKNKKRISLSIQEITYINEMSITIGLVMLTIGNFLGGQWANESWGRYWGWDPKETWALISIMVYSFVIHMRFVPALRGTWVYNVASMFAYYSVLMTYFGVNFYLSGLHSYAKGDQVVTPTFVWWSLGILSIFSFISYFKYKKYHKKAK